MRTVASTAKAIEKAMRSQVQLIVQGKDIVGVVGSTGHVYSAGVDPATNKVWCSCPGFRHRDVCYHSVIIALATGRLSSEKAEHILQAAEVQTRPERKQVVDHGTFETNRRPLF